MTEFIDPQGNRMVPLRCQDCGDQIGVVSPTWDYLNDENVIALCYRCAAVAEAEAITKEVVPAHQPDTSEQKP